MNEFAWQLCSFQNVAFYLYMNSFVCCFLLKLDKNENNVTLIIEHIAFKCKKNNYSMINEQNEVNSKYETAISSNVNALLLIPWGVSESFSITQNTWLLRISIFVNPFIIFAVANIHLNTQALNLITKKIVMYVRIHT